MHLGAMCSLGLRCAGHHSRVIIGVFESKHWMWAGRLPCTFSEPHGNAVLKTLSGRLGIQEVSSTFAQSCWLHPLRKESSRHKPRGPFERLTSSLWLRWPSWSNLILSKYVECHLLSLLLCLLYEGSCLRCSAATKRTELSCLVLDEGLVMFLGIWGCVKTECFWIWTVMNTWVPLL